MRDKEIILSKISVILSEPGFLHKDNSIFKKILKSTGLGMYFDEYQEYLVPYYYNNGYKNFNQEFDVFLGLDGIFSDLYKDSDNESIILLLKELVNYFNVYHITGDLWSKFNELVNLYGLLGLSVVLDEEEFKVSTCMSNDSLRVNEIFSVESWLKSNYMEVYESYKSAIDSYTDGHDGACIESCRTCLVSIFMRFKGTDPFAKWVRGAFNISGDSDDSTIDDLKRALDNDLKQSEIADFFEENKDGKLKKTKMIYMIYSMMSDYGTHRNESTQEIPSMEDALLSLRLTDSILFWIYSKNK